MLLPPFTVARNVSTLKGCFTTRHPVPVVGSSFYSEQSVGKTRIISLSDDSGRVHFFLQRNTG
jgi:hypothetical protein